MSETLLKVEGLKKHFPVGGTLGKSDAVVRAVEDVSFSIGRRRIVGLVGESGSGKTTVGRTILKLVEPTGGRVEYDGTDIAGLSAKAMQTYRSRMQIIFQDPYSSLNPRLTIGAILTEAMCAHRDIPRAERQDRVGALLQQVGLRPDFMQRYPHEFSGGQRQRVGIARALAVQPEFVVADECVSALDVSVQAQVLNLLLDLQEQLSLTMLFIAHDLAVVDYLCDDVVVMYLGRIMEIAPAGALRQNARHPYTRALVSAAPLPDPKASRDRIVLKGDIPSPIAAPSGCVFRTRCPHAVADCAAAVPPLRESAPGHFSACIREEFL